METDSETESRLVVARGEGVKEVKGLKYKSVVMEQSQGCSTGHIAINILITLHGAR